MIQKYPGNPIVKPTDVPPSHPDLRVMGAFNPGAVRFGDEVLLLMRVAERCEPKEGKVRMPYYRFAESTQPAGNSRSEQAASRLEIMQLDASDPEVTLKDTRGVYYRGRDYLSTMSHIRLARSIDGFNFAVEEKPFIFPVNQTEEYGVEDARVTYIDGSFYLNYTAVSRDSWATALAITSDFKSIERKGLIFHPENKDVAIFPEKIHDKYFALHRPNNSGFGKASIWLSESPDLLHWGNHRCLLRPRDNPWEAMKIGGGAPPIKTPQGWLVIYHGKGENSLYSLWALLLDLDDPFRIIERSSQPVLIPSEPYETKGFFPNVVFSNGVVEMDGKLLVYYGAADESVCVAMTDINSIINTF
jgi:predicted GH43/DUF377 family glycosyl hydrolase